MSRKTFSDTKAVCKCIERCATEEGLDQKDCSFANLEWMFEVAMNRIFSGKMDKTTKARAQNKWPTVLLHIRYKLKKEKAAANGDG